MHVSVIICTWNRAELLEQTLEQMHKLQIPVGVTWELIVVDNHCTDATQSVLAKNSQALPLRALYEPQPGKSHAANRAIAAAQGELLLWTDDDALVDPQWLAEYVAAAERWPEAMYFGGVVEPWFAIKPPGWVQRHLKRLECVYAIRQIEADILEVRTSQPVYGVNMAIRRAALRGMTFNTRIGPRKNTQVRGEEIELLERFERRGYVGRWVHSARVRHYIPAERLTSAYLLAYFAGASRTVERLKPASERTSGAKLGGLPRWAIRQFLVQRCRMALLSPLKNKAWLASVERAGWAKGILLEARESARSERQALASGAPSSELPS